MESKAQVTRLPLPKAENRLSQSKPAKSRTTGYVPRKGAPRTRTGCKVCKIRKIKCDEGRPACLRCTSTGRRCDGYLDQCQTSVIALVNYAKYDCNDERSLHIFRLVSEGGATLHHESTSWTRLVLQLAKVYPSVRSSVRAIGTIYEAYLRGDVFTQRPQGVIESPQDQAILLQYTLATKSVADDLTARRRPPQIILVCCLLFVWLELLRNNSGMALMHLQSGLNIIKSLHPFINDTQMSQVHSTPLKSMGLLVYRMFIRLSVQATFHGMPSSTSSVANLWLPENTIATAHPKQFSTVQDAAALLDILMLHIAYFVREKQETERQPNFSNGLPGHHHQLESTRRALLSDLGHWRNSFSYNALLMTDSAVNLVSLGLLEVQYLTAFIILKTVFSTDDTKMIEFYHQFKRIVLLCSEILERCTSSNTIQTLSLAAGLIPALFFTTMKCREPSVRNEALRLLKMTPAREGLWHRDTMVAAAIWKMDTEDKLKTRIYAETVIDATHESDTARVYFSGGDLLQPLLAASNIEGLLSNLGDIV